MHNIPLPLLFDRLHLYQVSRALAHIVIQFVAMLAHLSLYVSHLSFGCD
jgi:hypothetical protein